MEVSLDEIKEIARICIGSELQVLYLEIGDVRLALSKTDASLPLLRDLVRGGGAGEDTADLAAAATPRDGDGAGTAPQASPAAEGQAPPQAAVAPVPAAVPDAAARGRWAAVTAPTLGVFYRRPSPEQPPFVEVGSEVQAGDTVCLIEVMKTYTRVQAPCAGRVAELAVEDGAMVEYGQTLVWVEPQ